jgi:hypothetical protein
MIKEDVWFAPYENFTLSEMVKNINLASLLKSVSDEKFSEQYTSVITLHEVGDFKIELDRAFVSPNDRNKDPEGRRIYYPVDLPRPEELIRLDENKALLNHFGELSCMKELYEEDITKLYGKDLYMCGLYVHTPKGVFFSIGNVDREAEEIRPGAVFYFWKPCNSDGPIGRIYLPIDMRSLKRLQFRFSKLDQNSLYKASSLFE